MTQVYVLIEACDGEEPSMTVYGSIGDAVDNASELASLNGWSKVDGLLRWEEPDAWFNYVEVQAQDVL